MIDLLDRAREEPLLRLRLSLAQDRVDRVIVDMLRTVVRWEDIERLAGLHDPDCQVVTGGD